MDEEDNIIGRVAAELKQDIREPFATSTLARASRLSEEEWNRAAKLGESLAVSSAIWSLKLKMLATWKRNLMERNLRNFHLRIALFAALFGGFVFSWVGAASDADYYADFFNYDTEDFFLWFAFGCALFGILTFLLLRANLSRWRESILGGAAGALFSIVISYGPGRRGIPYWLVHDGIWRILIGMALGFLVLEIWRRQKKQ